MRWMRALAAMSLSLSCMTPAPALAGSVGELEQYGPWSYQNISTPGGIGCAMVTDQIDGDGRFTLAVTSIRQTDLMVFVRRPSWSVPEGVFVSVRLMFPGGAEYMAAGFGNGAQMAMAVPTASVPGFLHDLATAITMTVVFNGTELPWSLHVTGADKTIARMKHCVAQHGFVGAPVPLGAGGTPTRPY